MKAAELLFQCLENEGVKYLFGTSFSEIISANTSENIKLINSQPINSLVKSGGLYSRHSNKSVVFFTNSEQETNEILLNLNKSTSVVVFEFIKEQDFTSHKSIFKDKLKYHEHVFLKDHDIASTIKKAFKNSESEKIGISLIRIDPDFLDTETEQEPLQSVRTELEEIKHSEIEKVTDLVCNSKNVILLVGSAAVRNKYTIKNLSSFIDEFNLPLFLTLGANGMTQSENLICSINSENSDSFTEVFNKADLVIKVGIEDFELQEFVNLIKEKKVVNISYLSENDQDLELISEISDSLDKLHTRLKIHGYENKSNWAKEFKSKFNNNNLNDRLNLLIESIQNVNEDHILFVNEENLNKAFKSNYLSKRPNSFYIANNFPISGALGVKLASQKSHVICITNQDYLISDLNAILKLEELNLSLIIIVWPKPLPKSKVISLKKILETSSNNSSDTLVSNLNKVFCMNYKRISLNDTFKEELENTINTNQITLLEISRD